jgi:hypothetical protein
MALHEKGTLHRNDEILHINHSGTKIDTIADRCSVGRAAACLPGPMTLNVVREGNCRNRTNVKLITPVPRDDWNIVGSPLEFRRF